MILPEALEMDHAAEVEFPKFKSSGEDPQRSKRQRKRRPEERLRMADPWWGYLEK